MKTCIQTNGVCRRQQCIIRNGKSSSIPGIFAPPADDFQGPGYHYSLKNVLLTATHVSTQLHHHSRIAIDLGPRPTPLIIISLFLIIVSLPSHMHPLQKVMNHNSYYKYLRQKDVRATNPTRRRSQNEFQAVNSDVYHAGGKEGSSFFREISFFGK